MKQRLSLDGFRQKNKNSKLTQRFMQSTMMTVTKNIFLRLMLVVLSIFKWCTFHFCLKKWVLSNARSWCAICLTRRTKSYTSKPYGLVSEKVHRVIRFNKEAWLKSYIDMNTELREKTKNGFKKDLLELMNNFVSEKTIKNV